MLYLYYYNELRSLFDILISNCFILFLFLTAFINKNGEKVVIYIWAKMISVAFVFIVGIIGKPTFFSM